MCKGNNNSFKMFTLLQDVVQEKFNLLQAVFITVLRKSEIFILKSENISLLIAFLFSLSTLKFSVTLKVEKHEAHIYSILFIYIYIY